MIAFDLPFGPASPGLVSTHVYCLSSWATEPRFEFREKISVCIFHFRVFRIFGFSVSGSFFSAPIVKKEATTKMFRVIILCKAEFLASAHPGLQPGAVSRNRSQRHCLLVAYFETPEHRQDGSQTVQLLRRSVTFDQLVGSLIDTCNHWFYYGPIGISF